jgi:hypothetical protein
MAALGLNSDGTPTLKQDGRRDIAVQFSRARTGRLGEYRAGGGAAEGWLLTPRPTVRGGRAITDRRSDYTCSDHATEDQSRQWRGPAGGQLLGQAAFISATAPLVWVFSPDSAVMILLTCAADGGVLKLLAAFFTSFTEPDS